MQPTTITATHKKETHLRSKNKNKIFGKNFLSKNKKQKKKKPRKNEKKLSEKMLFFSFLPFVGPLVGCV